MSGDLYVSDTPQRFAFAMLAKEGYASQGTATFAVAPDGTKPTEFVETTLHEAGLPERRGVYVAELVFDKEGVWDGVADREGEKLPFVFQVKAKADAPTVGAAAPNDASPTPSIALGVDPICTRDPMCPLHTLSLDTVIGEGQARRGAVRDTRALPVAVLRPGARQLLPLVGAYQDRVDIVHVDIYKDLRTNETSPTVTAWNLPSEPWLFGVDAAGAITARLDGAFGQDEMRAVLDALATPS